jgi:hypothetical protein
VGWLDVPGIEPPEVAEVWRQKEDNAARSLGLKIHRVAVRGTNDLAQAFAALGQQGVHAVIGPAQGTPWLSAASPGSDARRRHSCSGRTACRRLAPATSPKFAQEGFSEDVASGPGRERFVRPGSVIYARTIRVSLVLVAARVVG